eukprot:Rhum_TRINITY_DN3317_c0_g1::Rhum_TRINITY_DN3317_c0_g1_i1::g.10347::m.10347/K00505/TYR; tyrosinase
MSRPVFAVAAAASLSFATALVGESCGEPPHDCVASKGMAIACPPGSENAYYGYVGGCWHQAGDANECGAFKPLCTCDSSCSTCGTVRKRKAWSSLPCAERNRYIRAVKEFRTSTPSQYNNFALRHDSAWDYAHYTSAFLPWHRAFLLEFENKLRALGGEFACVTIPYWDADRDSGNELLTHPLRKDTWGSHLGVDGGACLTEGICAFGWGPALDGTCLKRGYSAWATFADQATVAALVTSYPDYHGFRAYGEGTPHSVPHSFIGHNMVTHRSPEEPLFFMHHANIDRFFALWQDYRGLDEKPKPLYADYTLDYFPKTDSPSNPFSDADLELDQSMQFLLPSSTWTIRDMMHLHDMPGTDAHGVSNSYVYGNDNLAVLLGTPVGGTGWHWFTATEHGPHECVKTCDGGGGGGKGGCAAEHTSPFPFDVADVVRERDPRRREAAILNLAWQVCTPARERFTMDPATEKWLRSTHPDGPRGDLSKHYPCGVLPRLPLPASPATK